jgi:hypothetical protein
MLNMDICKAMVRKLVIVNCSVGLGVVNNQNSDD